MTDNRRSDGRVTTNLQPGIGFGLVFSFLTEDEEEALREFMV